MKDEDEMYTVFNYAVKNYTFIREELLVIFIFLRSAQPNYFFKSNLPRLFIIFIKYSITKY